MERQHARGGAPAPEPPDGAIEQPDGARHPDEGVRAHEPGRQPGRGSIPRVLSIAGTDPTGGAGTAADLKSITAAGGYGMAVVTALVAQNTCGVRGLHRPPVDFLRQQLDAVSDDVVLDAVKTGMLCDAEVIGEVSAWLDQVRPPVLVVDPVMVSTSGHRLLDADAEDRMRDFCTRATVVTPNIAELGVLTGHGPASDERTAIAWARDWAAAHGVAVVVKTGHLDGRHTSNTWVAPDGGLHTARALRVDTTSTHGTGCSLSSALATRLAAGDTPASALDRATDWLHEAIRHGADLHVGHGHGPVDHSHRARRLEAVSSVTPWVDAGSVPDEWSHPGQLASTGPGTPAPGLEPAGPWTAALWAAGAATTRDIVGGDFVQALGNGSLSRAAFEAYLAQDALYLQEYARALALLAARSTTATATAHWAAAAAQCHEAESELHRTELAGVPALAQRPVATPVTSAYTSSLVACAAVDPVPVAAAAVLPCFWLYAHVGASLPPGGPEHPFAAWLLTYADPAFATSVRAALHEVEHLLAHASPRERASAARAYLTSCRHEAEFFDQVLRPGGGAR